MTTVSTNIESVQIIKIEESKFIFNKEAFINIINENEQYKDLPVGVIIINGALRTGKSFFSNFMIRYFEKLENKEDVSFTEEEEMLKDYFISRRGANIQTLGIWALNKVFKINNMAIVLMDTQGIFDHELSQAMTIALISISCICSSYQIYNLDKRIQENHLCNMAYFSSYSNLISNYNQSKIGQTLCLLIRDWQNFEDQYDITKCDREADSYKREFLHNNMNDTKKETREKIFNTYDDIIVRLCPHPGYLVTENKFSGKLSDVREEFKLHVNHFIERMIVNIKPKRMTNEQNLLLRELPNYMSEYIDLYDNIKSDLPQPLTILETTEKICQENARSRIMHIYKRKMLTKIKNNNLSKHDIKKLHDQYSRESKDNLNELYIMGSIDDVIDIKNNIMNDINNEYIQFEMMGRKKYMLQILFDKLCDYIMPYIDNDNYSRYIIICSCIYISSILLLSFSPRIIIDMIIDILKLGMFFLAGSYIAMHNNNNNNDITYISDLQ